MKSTARPLRSWVCGLVEVGVILAAVCFLLGLFGRVFWVFDLLSHFRVPYAVALLGGGVVFILVGRRRWAVASMGGGGLLLGTMVFPFQAHPPAASGIKPWKLISYNVNTANMRYDDVRRFLEAEDADAIFLMEVNAEWMEKLRPLEAGYAYHLVETREDNFGIALLSKSPITGGIEEFGDYGLPWIDAEIAGFRLLAVHPIPPSSAENSRSRNKQLSLVAQRAAGQARVIVCGDLNVTPFSPWFWEMLKAGGLRHAAPPVSPTWLRAHPLFALELDHVLLSSDLALARRVVGDAMGSDHNPLVVEIAPAE